MQARWKPIAFDDRLGRNDAARLLLILCLALAGTWTFCSSAGCNGGLSMCLPEVPELRVRNQPSVKYHRITAILARAGGRIPNSRHRKAGRHILSVPQWESMSRCPCGFDRLDVFSEIHSPPATVSLCLLSFQHPAVVSSPLSPPTFVTTSPFVLSTPGHLPSNKIPLKQFVILLVSPG